MKRSTRTALVVAIATVTAAIASVAVYAAISSIPVREVEVAHAYAVVAVRSLPMGAQVTERDVKLVPWPSSSPVAGGFDRVEAVVKRGLIAGVVENEPLTESKLAPLEAGAGLPPTIPTGMRAMSVKVDEVIGVAGFVVPGTRVDLVVTVRPGGNEDPMSRAVVSNVLVLTAGTRYDQEQNVGKPLPSTVVTLAVTPDDVEKIALASSEGKISLALRNPLDVEPTQTSGIGVTALMRGAAQPVAPPAPARRRVAPAPKPAAPAPVVVPPPYTVETIRAAKRAAEVVR